MNINAIKIHTVNYIGLYTNSKTNSLKRNPISFGAMKKSQFEGLDILVVNQFKAPIEKFNNNDDFQTWCRDKSAKIESEDISARTKQTLLLRKWVMRYWIKFLNNSDISAAKRLLILNSLIKDLDPKDDRLPPVFREEIFEKTVKKCESLLKFKPNSQINFIKEYRENLWNDALGEFDETLDRKKSGWVIIPSKTRAPEDFKKNIELLKVLSHHNWCTNMYYADPYLEKGDFHIYLDKGYPALGIRFVDDTVKEIQGELNNSKIPIKYSNVAKEHLKNYKLAFKVESELEETETSIKNFE